MPKHGLAIPKMGDDYERLDEKDYHELLSFALNFDGPENDDGPTLEDLT